MGEMMTKIRTLLVCLTLVILSGCGIQGSVPLEPTAHNDENDLYIVFLGNHFENVTRFLPIDVLGKALFELQEGTHARITDVTGAELDYFYIWVCLGEQCLPVDPFTFSS